MARGVLLGIDLGTTVLKAAAFDARTGRPLARSSIRLKVRAGEDGTREQDPGQISRALKKALSTVGEELGASRTRISGVGLAAQGGSTLIADRESGRTCTPMMLWNDARAREYARALAARKPRSYWQKLSRRDAPGAGLARMLWLKDRRPELFCEENIYVGAGEYLYFMLTGAWRQDAGNALQMGCYRVSSRELDPSPLELVGVPVSFVAPMRRGHETHPLSKEAAKRYGLSHGIPVAGPYLDHEAGFLSAVGISARPLQCSLGTAWVGNFILPEKTAGGSPFQLVLPAPVGLSAPGTSRSGGAGELVVQPLLTGNVAWDWGLQTLLAESHEKALLRLDAVFGEELLPPEGLVCLPWFARANPLEPSSFGGGVFSGMSPQTGRAEMIRALAAGLSYEMARVFEEVRTSGLVDGVVLGGGASRGVSFRRLLSALFAPLSVFVLTDEGLAGARGTVFSFGGKAARAAAVRVPRPGARLLGRIRKGFELYLGVFERLYGGISAGGAFRFGKGAQG